ncbi:MAG: EF-hand domain-containing protein [Verrucomicrobiota bacterium]
MTVPLRFIVPSALAIFGGALLGSCAKPSRYRVPKNPAAHKQFDALDTNKDGKLSYTEFLKAPLARKSDNPKALFGKIDTSGDGYVTVPEWREYKLKNKKSS